MCDVFGCMGVHGRRYTAVPDVYKPIADTQKPKDVYTHGGDHLL